jgi:hypothetical protein
LAAIGPRARKYLIAWILVRYVAIGLLALSLVFSVINPILAVVLIVAVAVGSNVALRLVARLNWLNTTLYVVYVGIMIGVVALWLSSIITTVQAAAIVIPVSIGYWTISWIRIGK